jgi:PAS domain S-box-containing protein
MMESLKLLYVEDEPVIRELLHEMLQQHYSIDTAENGMIGLDLFSKTRPDIVLSDVTMPEMNGLEMSRQMKQMRPDVPIILMTAHHESEFMGEAIDIGIDAYLIKPIDFSKLLRLLEKFSKNVQAQKKLVHERKILQEYRHAVDKSGPVSRMDLTKTITYVNTYFCDITGYTRDELIGHPLDILRHPDVPPKFYVEMWRRVVDKKFWRGRVKNRKKDGSTYYVNAVIVPITDEDDNIVEFLALFQDITDLYEHEIELQKRIASEVEKNIKLHEQQERERLLETKFSTIGRMAAGITHEINTPLTYIRGNAEILLEDIEELKLATTDKQYLLEDIKTILSGVNRIASIVESMREMSSQTKEHPEPSNVYTSLQTALTLAYNHSKQISKIFLQGSLFELNMPRDRSEYTAFMQSQRIEQVWIIIINNALEALKKIDDYESRSLEITIDDKDDLLMVTFQDNGGGIDETILPKIFEPFESSKVEGGMGIGLNVAKKIIDDHQGKIVPSNHAKGARFQVYLPKQEHLFET